MSVEESVSTLLPEGAHEGERDDMLQAVLVLLHGSGSLLDVITRGILSDKQVPLQPLPAGTSDDEADHTGADGHGTFASSPDSTLTQSAAIGGGEDAGGGDLADAAVGDEVAADEPPDGLFDDAAPGFEGDMSPVAGPPAQGGGSDGDDADAVLRSGEDEDGAVDPSTSDAVAGQFGSRLSADKLYYPNLVAFVECFVAHVWPYYQAPNIKFVWTSRWWRYPALVFPLDAVWRAYESARQSPAQMMIFYLQATNLLSALCHPDTGVIASLDIGDREYTSKGSPLPCVRPPRGWRGMISRELSIEFADEPSETPGAPGTNEQLL
ncbi:MAG: DUF4913 domain-containing protein [Bifidobacterium crudilactis]|nr:DUF4913 domain-containing protein [Bifidobacterium crudilactis]